MAGWRRFVVKIAEIGASGLVCPPHPDPDHVISPFCRINFAQSFRVLQTECLENEDEPNWSTTFSFLFETVQDLSELTLEISAYDRNEPEAIYLGKTITDLHTIATGPALQDLQLERQADSPAGRISLIVEMTEFCPNLACCVSNIEVVIERQAASSPSPSRAAKIEISYSERQDKKQCSEVVSVYDHLKVRLQNIEPLSIAASVEELENSFINLSVLLKSNATDSGSDWIEIERCRLPLARYHPANPDIQKFVQDMTCHDSRHRLQITGTIMFLNGPSMAQMLSGSNTEHGVHPGPIAWPGVEISRNCLGEIPENNAGLDRFASLRSSICWRAPTVHYDEADLVVSGNARKWTPDENIQSRSASENNLAI